MPQRNAAGIALQFCYASPLARLNATPPGLPAGEHPHAVCAFAAAAAPGLPGTAIELPQFPAVTTGKAAPALVALSSRFSGGRPPARAPPTIS